MATFGRAKAPIVPSEFGEPFPIDTHVLFHVHNRLESGTITKQLKNSAVIELDETDENQELINQSNGVVIINYKHMKKA